MSQLTAGTYMATPTGEASVYENEKGNLILCMEFHCEGEALRYYTALYTANDGVNTRAVETLKAIFGWDGIDFFWFVDHAAELQAREVEVVIEMRPGREGDRLFPSIRYLNEPGGSGGLPEAGDRNALLAKYSAKFRAVAGGTPSAPPKPPAANTPPPPQAPPAPDVEPSDQMTVWQRHCELGGTEKDWFNVLTKAVPGVDQGDFTPAQWGQALAYIEANTIPY